MKKKIMSLALALVMCMTLCLPAYAVDNEDTCSNSCTLENGSILSSETLDNGNLLISLSKDGILLESTETDYENKTLTTTRNNSAMRNASIQVISFDSFIDSEAAEQDNPVENISTLSSGTYYHFADVSFRSQIGTDFYFTPTAQVFVRDNTPGDLVKQKVNVGSLGGSVTEVVSGFSVALGLIAPELSAVQSFLIAMGILVGGELVSSIDYVSLESRRYGESIRAIYNSNSVDYDEGAHIVASGDAHNGKYKNQTFYDGMCQYNILNGNLSQGRQIFNSFFKSYGTCRSMSVTAV